jgi:high-affinity iron transporter
MLSSALIIFREVFEVVLIVGIILAATRGIAHRQKAIYLGFGAGLLGSVLVAVFMNQISAFAEGIGQEIFNAGVLFTAAAFIGWTVIWMKRHSHEMKGHFSTIGQSVSEGRLPFYSLSAGLRYQTGIPALLLCVTFFTHFWKSLLIIDSSALGTRSHVDVTLI